MATIHFENANAYGIKVEDINNMDKSIFKNLYDKATKCVCNIVKRVEESSIDDASSFFYDVDENNNIIAFSGERGSGKTTAMLTFVNFLRADSKSHQKFLKLFNKKDENDCDLSEYTFVSLPVIDPSKLSDGESLLGPVVSRIYEEIKKIYSNNLQGDYNSLILRKAVEKCEATYKAIRVKHQSIKESLLQNPDDLEHLSELANTSQLRNSMQELIRAYLDLWCNVKNSEGMSKAGTNKQFLIIPIDDLDTNIEKGHLIAEEIRCFFMLPNVLIPIALKIEQMCDIVEQKFMIDFGKMLDRKMLDVQPAEMAVKYIEKLIPMQRRLMLPVFEYSALNEVRIVTNKTKLEGSSSQNPKIVDYFLELIWKSTGILLTKNQYDSHPLIPLNLRAMHQMIDLFEEFGKASINDMVADGVYSISELEKLNKNLNRLEIWVLDSVSSNSVPRGMATIIRRLASHPVDGLNSFLVRQLMNYGIDEKIQGIDKDGEIQFSGLFGRDPLSLSILQTDVNPDNISLGDIFYLMDKMMEVNSSDGIRHFVAALKIIYSIKISRLIYTYEESPKSREEAIFKPDLKSISCLISGLICNPSLTLSPTGREWMSNIDLSGAPLPKDEPDSRKRMTLSQTIWISFFIVAYGRLKKNDLHSFTGGGYPSSKAAFYLLQDGLPFFVSAHWMAFLTSSLTINQTIERFIGILSNSNEIKNRPEYKEFVNKLQVWQEKYLYPIPINCIDVVSLILNNMHKKHLELDNPENISKLNEYFTIIVSLKNSLVYALENTCLQGGENEAYNNILEAFESCPLINNDEFVKDYLVEETSERSYDWLTED